MKFIKVVIVCCFIAGIIWSAPSVWRAYTNVRGARPAFGPPAGDIVREMEKPAQNSSDFPLRLPVGISISLFAKGLGSPRVLTFDPEGTILVSIPSRGQVVALPDENRDGVTDRTEVILDSLNRPHGIALHPKSQSLYVAETDQVAVYDYDSKTFKASNKRKLVDLPKGGNHITRTIGFGPDRNLYISIGSSCNACIEDDERRAKMLVVTDRGTTDYATGLRNAVFFTWHPKTIEMWATEMGRDLLGDDTPPDEVNIVKYGKFYGWPYCYGKNVQDKTFTDDKGLNMLGFQGLTISEVCIRAAPSHIDIPAHSAPLGLAFIPSNPLVPLNTSDPSDPSQIPKTPESEGVKKIAAATKTLPSLLWPEEYQGDLLVAYHGSWNRSEPTGYKVVRMKLDEQGNYQGVEDFITGWLTGGSALGRPVDLLFDTHGVLYISDDKAGIIYRVAYNGSK